MTECAETTGQPVICLLGPTCSWKSEAALKLALQLQAEIISCDSMQVYKGLEIGTAQPSPEAMRLVPHHLCGCWDIFHPYDANLFVELADTILPDMDARSKQAVLVGGTGLYARSWAYGLNLLPSDKALSMELRQRMEDESECKIMLDEVLAECTRRSLEVPKDVVQNPRRLLRCYEVWKLTGSFPWELAEKPTAPKPRFRQFCILPDWDLLRERIRRRTAKMLAAGWVQEALTAEAAGLSATPTARQALGYRDILEFQAKGCPGGEAALAELLANRTIQYARRQMTWFKHQHPGAEMIFVNKESDAVNIILDSVQASLIREK